MKFDVQKYDFFLNYNEYLKKTKRKCNQYAETNRDELLNVVFMMIAGFKQYRGGNMKKDTDYHRHGIGNKGMHCGNGAERDGAAKQ